MEGLIDVIWTAEGQIKSYGGPYLGPQALSLGDSIKHVTCYLVNVSELSNTLIWIVSFKLYTNTSYSLWPICREIKSHI